MHSTYTLGCHKSSYIVSLVRARSDQEVIAQERAHNRPSIICALRQKSNFRCRYILLLLLLLILLYSTNM